MLSVNKLFMMSMNVFNNLFMFGYSTYAHANVNVRTFANNLYYGMITFY